MGPSFLDDLPHGRPVSPTENRHGRPLPHPQPQRAHSPHCLYRGPGPAWQSCCGANNSKQVLYPKNLMVFLRKIHQSPQVGHLFEPNPLFCFLLLCRAPSFLDPECRKPRPTSVFWKSVLPMVATIPSKSKYPCWTSCLTMYGGKKMDK